MKDSNFPNSHSFYDRLLQYIKKQSSKSQDVARFKKNIRQYFSLTETTRSLREFFNGKNNDAPKQHQIEKARQLLLGFNIPYEVLLPDLEEKYIFTEHSPKFSYLEDFIPLNYAGKTKRDELDFINRYVKGLEKYLREGRINFTIYEYLGKGRQFSKGSALTYYEEAHKHIFRILEEQLTNHSTMTYVRFLALPFSASNLDQAKVNKKKYAYTALQECSVEAFKHFCRCFKNFDTQIKFYIVWRPTRLYHYAIIDDTYIISEYYRYRRDGDFVPDLLFIVNVTDEKDNQLVDLLKIYKDEIDGKLTKENFSRGFRIYQKDFIEAVKNAHEKTNNTLGKKY